MQKFIHKVSKGTRFNQIYVPKGMEEAFNPGDIVEVRLLKKKVHLHYSKNLPKLSAFKESLIRELFSFLSQWDEAKQSSIVGSFLTRKIEYNDIDIVIVTDKKYENIEERIYNKVIERFNLKFHIIAVPEERLATLLQICPLTRSMFYHYVSNKKVDIPPKKLDKAHIKFLLMMPEDLLEIKANAIVFYNALRRLIAIERFLENEKNKGEDPNDVDREIKFLLGEPLFSRLKTDEPIDEKTLGKVRELMKDKIMKIRALMGK